VDILRSEDPNKGIPNKEDKTEELKEEVKPSDDFKDLSVNPTVEELNDYDAPVLREIKKTEGFDDLYHYLDVNFRLLKEDFTSELRDGLQQYKNNPSERNYQVNMYSNAKIRGFFATKAYFGLKLCIFVKGKH
jgi:hypothetical protein